MKKRLITLRVNGEEHEVAIEPRRLLVEAIRDDLGLTGTKRGCESGVCGCCTVLLDGRNIKSCLMLAIQAQDAEVTTVEGLRGEDGGLHPIQEAYVNYGGLQCGYCTPGFIMTTKAFLDENPRPTEAEVREALSGNICRCTGYVKIVESILAASGQEVKHAHP
ncbi:MAG: (2Fe-2S)-binding protein [Candidatus Tectomicrobia bacterium]|nr:(2Fe-2S)-binding protein [Candidatus Tectomicrobia bacterium]